MWIFEVIYGGLLIIINGKKVNFKSHFFHFVPYERFPDCVHKLWIGF